MRVFSSALLILLTATSARASMLTDFSGYYETDSFVTTANAESSKIYYSLDVLFEVTKKAGFYAGFHAHQLSMSEKPAATTTTLNSTDLGAQVLYYFDSKMNFFGSAGYNLSANGQYSNGATKSDLTGSSYQASLGYEVKYSANISLGLRWNYLNVSYTKSSVSGVSSDVSYSRVLTFPALSLVWRN